MAQQKVAYFVSYAIQTRGNKGYSLGDGIVETDRLMVSPDDLAYLKKILGAQVGGNMTAGLTILSLALLGVYNQAQA